MSLAPCPSCRRHVRVRETQCPFCAAALPQLVARNVVLPRLGRAALVAAAMAATACRDKEPQATATSDQPVKAGDASVDASDAAKAGATDPTTLETDSGSDTASDADADEDVHLYHPPVSKYGAPPHPLPPVTMHPKYGAPPPPHGAEF